MKKTDFINALCRRGCGKMLTSASRSTWGLGELKKKYELICHDCLTKKEHEEMLHAMGKGIVNNHQSKGFIT